MNQEHGFDPAEDKLAEAISAMKSMPISDVPGNLLEGKQMSSQSTVVLARRDLLWKRMIAPVLAVSILLVAGVVLWPPADLSSSAFAQVLEEVEKTKSFRGKVIADEEVGTLSILGTKTRFVSLDRRTEIVCDTAAKKVLQIDHQTMTAYHLPSKPSFFMLDLIGLFRDLAASATEEIPRWEAEDGKSYAGLKGTAELKVEEKTAPVAVEVWSDPDSNLPVRLKITFEGAPSDATFVVDDMQFDLPLDEADFSLEIPAGYKEFGNQKLKEPLSAEEAAKLVIEPGIGVGKVKFGMTREELVEIMGEPEIDQFGSYLSCPSLGIQYNLSGGLPDQIGNIILNPGGAANAHRNEFPGKTVEGIGIGSTPEEVIAAWGKPDKESQWGPAELDTLRMVYKRKATVLDCLDGKVGQIHLYPEGRLK